MICSFFSGLMLLIMQVGFTFQTANYISHLNINHSIKGGYEINSSDNPVVSPNEILFVVKHSQGPNVVVYQANITSHKNLDDKKPIDVYWLMNTKGKTTENLTTIEWKLAYGFKIIQLIKGKKYKMSLNAIKDKEIIIDLESGGKVASYMNINGQYSKLKDVFINFEHTLYIPNVKYIEFIGNNMETGRLTAERVWAD